MIEQETNSANMSGKSLVMGTREFRSPFLGLPRKNTESVGGGTEVVHKEVKKSVL